MTEQEYITEIETEVDELRRVVWAILCWDIENVLPDELHKQATRAYRVQRPERPETPPHWERKQ